MFNKQVLVNETKIDFEFQPNDISKNFKQPSYIPIFKNIECLQQNVAL